MKLLFALLAILFLLPGIASAQRSTVIEALAPVNVTTAGGLVTGSTFQNSYHTSGYLTITTTTKVGSASLAVKLIGIIDGRDVDLCTMTAITTETTTVAVFGIDGMAAPAEGITDSCEYPLPKTFKTTYLVTGASGELTVEANINLLPL